MVLHVIAPKAMDSTFIRQLQPLASWRLGYLLGLELEPQMTFSFVSLNTFTCIYIVSLN